MRILRDGGCHGGVCLLCCLQFPEHWLQVLSNTDKAVEEATAKGFKALSSKGAGIKDPLTAVASLKGIGPATASAVLAPVAPGRFPFMADEALEGAGLHRAYTVEAYLEFAKVLQAKASSLGECLYSVSRSLVRPWMHQNCMMPVLSSSLERCPR